MRHVIKVNKTKSQFRITIPQSVIQEKRWGDVKIVLVEDHHQDKIIITRLIEEKAINERAK
jgi:hypothetical protein